MQRILASVASCLVACTALAFEPPASIASPQAGVQRVGNDQVEVSASSVMKHGGLSTGASSQLQSTGSRIVDSSVDAALTDSPVMRLGEAAMQRPGSRLAAPQNRLAAGGNSLRLSLQSQDFAGLRVSSAAKYGQLAAPAAAHRHLTAPSDNQVTKQPSATK